MIRKLFLSILLIAAPAALLAQSLQQATLLTPAGRLFVVESDFAHVFEAEGTAPRIMRLTVQDDGETSEEWIPASLHGGWHSDPSLAYDEESDTLFLFWQHSRSLAASELLIASYRDGTWSDPVQINSAAFKFRSHFRIATTRWSTVRDPESEPQLIANLAVHAIYWEQTGEGEEARYAMISFRDGAVAGVEERSPQSWVTGGDFVPAELPEDFDREVFRHPAILESSKRDSVDIIFADWNRNRLQRITVLPIREDGVLNVPDGIWKGEMPAPGPGVIQANATVETIVSGPAAAIYTRTPEELRYQLLAGDDWSETRTVVATRAISLDRALDALNRLVAERAAAEVVKPVPSSE